MTDELNIDTQTDVPETRIEFVWDYTDKGDMGSYYPVKVTVNGIYFADIYTDQTIFETSKIAALNDYTVTIFASVIPGKSLNIRVRGWDVMSTLRQLTSLMPPF